MSDIVEKLPTRSEFSAELDTIFHADLADEGLDMVLVECDEVVSNDVQENFTLLFRAPFTVSPQQGIYNLRHPRLGTMEIFLVPVKKDDSGLYYEAVFNLLKAAAA